MTFNFSNGVIEALGIHLKSWNLIAITICRQSDDQQRNHRSTCAEFKQLTQALSNYLMELSSSTPDLIICDDLGPTRISSKWHPRRGRICHVPNVLPSAPPRIQSIQRALFGIKGPQLFNSLPIHLRNLTKIPVDKFKAMLDQFLCSVPDQPLIPGYTRYRTVNTNSIIGSIANARLQSEGSTTQTMSEMLIPVVAPVVSP